MTTLELVIAGLAMIWSPAPGCNTPPCPATVYFPAGYSSDPVCGKPLKSKHHLALVFNLDDLNRGESQNGTFTVHRVPDDTGKIKEIGIERICHDIELIADGSKHKGVVEEDGSCDPSDGDNFDPSSFECIVDMDRDIKPKLELNQDKADKEKQLEIPEGTLKARHLAKKKGTADDYILWEKPYSAGEKTGAIANTAVLDLPKITGPVVIKGTDCDDRPFKLQFEEGRKLYLAISNLPSHPDGGTGNSTSLDHLYWHYPLLEFQNGPGCNKWGTLTANVPPGDIITGVGSADVFCPPSSGP